MRFFKLVIVSIVFFLLIITGISLFIPADVTISRAVQINSSREAVMEQIRDPSQWKHWYPSANTAELYYENGEVQGLILDSARERYLVISTIRENEVLANYVVAHKKIKTGWQVVAASGLNSVTVQWYMKFHLRWYPWEKFSTFMFERLYGPQIQQGLDNLKSRLEK